MDNLSPSTGVKRLEGEIRQILRRHEIDKLDFKARKNLAELQQDLVDARIYTQAYELSETADEQHATARAAKSWLAKAEKCILAASQYDIFGPVDVAHLSAQIELIIDKLKVEL